MHQNSHLDSYLRGKTDLAIELPRLEAKKTIDDIRINPDLSPEQQEQLKCLVREFSDVLIDLPGQTSVVEHEIKLISEEPVRSKPYPVPHALKYYKG